MRANRLRELLKADQPSVGTHLHISWPSVTELVGHARILIMSSLSRNTRRTISILSKTSAGRSAASPT